MAKHLSTLAVKTPACQSSALTYVFYGTVFILSLLCVGLALYAYKPRILFDDIDESPPDIRLWRVFLMDLLIVVLMAAFTWTGRSYHRHNRYHKW